MRIQRYLLNSYLFFGLLIVFFLLIITAVTAGFVYTGSAQQNKVLTSNECFLAGGEVRNTLGTSSKCGLEEKYLGEVEGLFCPCICCQFK